MTFGASPEPADLEQWMFEQRGAISLANAEATLAYTRYQQAQRHLSAARRRVVISAIVLAPTLLTWLFTWAWWVQLQALALPVHFVVGGVFGYLVASLFNLRKVRASHQRAEMAWKESGIKAMRQSTKIYHPGVYP